jgi:hypothetical protein
MHVELNGIEVERSYFSRRLFQAVGKVARKNAGLHHD